MGSTACGKILTNVLKSRGCSIEKRFLITSGPCILINLIIMYLPVNILLENLSISQHVPGVHFLFLYVTALIWKRMRLLLVIQWDLIHLFFPLCNFKMNVICIKVSRPIGSEVFIYSNLCVAGGIFFNWGSYFLWRALKNIRVGQVWSSLFLMLLSSFWSSDLQWSLELLLLEY